MKSSGVTIQMKPLQQYFHMVLLVLSVVSTFEYVYEILWYDHSNETICLLVLYRKKYGNFSWLFFQVGHF